jgi:hypothetical protein
MEAGPTAIPDARHHADRAVADLRSATASSNPNISTIVGTLYAQGDRRRDAGFTIFYMGINLGRSSAVLLPVLADWIGWWAGLSLAGSAC